jgi:hypothetical protein
MGWEDVSMINKQKTGRRNSSRYSTMCMEYRRARNNDDYIRKISSLHITHIALIFETFLSIVNAR